MVRIGLNVLLCTGPQVIREMSPVRSSYTKGSFDETGRMPGEGTVVSLRDEKMQEDLQAKMSRAVRSTRVLGTLFKR